MSAKSICYYYKIVNENNKSVFRCLFDGRYDIVERKSRMSYRMLYRKSRVITRMQ